MRVILASLVLGPVALGQTSAAPARPPQQTTPVRADHAAAVRERVEVVLKKLVDDQKFDDALSAMNPLLDEAIAYTPVGDPSLLLEVAHARRLISTVATAPEADRASLLAFLRRHDVLARHLLFTLVDEDDAPGALGVLNVLREAHGDGIAELPALAAALCVVHDRPLRLSVSSEEREMRADPAALFGYFKRNRSRMLFDPGSLPAELLVFVVDSHAAVDELEWALGKHAGDRNVGKRYHDLVYDTAHFKFNRPKKIAALEYTLPNLRKVGGVCEEQAYFASHVAKAIGVPSATISGRRAEMGHAWVGFLQRRGGRTVFNCDEGLYDEYEKARGTTQDPQTGRAITQSQLELMAGLLDTPNQRRWGAIALLDAAQRLRSRNSAGATWPPPASAGSPLVVVASADDAAQIKLLERACELAPASPRAWLTAADWGARMQNADRDRFFRAVNRAASGGTPDFAYLVTRALITSMPDSPAAITAWEWLSKQYPARPDLCGDALIGKGDLQLKLEDKVAAYDTYVDVARRYVNEGPFVLTALSRAERMLERSGKQAVIAELYRDMFRRCARPSGTSAAFFAGSNYNQIGQRAAEHLRETGREREAEQILRQLRAAEPEE